MFHQPLMFVIGSALLTAGLTCATNWLALIPWRKKKAGHWSEQARLLYPVSVATRSNLWTIPTVLVLAELLVWPRSPSLWWWVGLGAAFGAVVGTIPMDHEVFPQIPFRALLRQTGINFLMRILFWLAFVGAIAAMPDQLNGVAWLLGLAMAGLWVIWGKIGWMWAGRMLGLFVPAPERLQRIAGAAATKMNVALREVWLVRSSVAQAYAFPDTGKLLFTERLLELLPDAELAAVCSHELAHLTESAAVRHARTLNSMIFLPWLFINPLSKTYGPVAFYGLLALTVAVPMIYRRISFRLETRADEMAKTNEGDPGTYAIALLRLHQDSLVAAVLPKDRATHPHLYDRMLAAGVTPDFPRPAAAGTMAWHGVVFAMLLGGFASVLILSQTR
jgi:Zn-dependent protease with chaperone function